MWYKFRKSAAVDALSGLHVVERQEGLEISPQPASGSRPLRSGLVRGLLAQLEDDGRAERGDAGWTVEWNVVYELIETDADARAVALFELPPHTASVQLDIYSRGSLEDPAFRITIGAWRVAGIPLREAVPEGAVLTHDAGRLLLSRSNWLLYQAIDSFASRPESERTGASHRREWGRIRRLAVAAGAGLDAFLKKTIVLTPEKLSIGLRRVDIAGERVIEIEPSFDEAPEGWLRRFDQQASVPGRYDFVVDGGLIQVVVSPEVRTVLEEIRRLPFRRVAGARAQAFIVNPYAALGQHASAVIDEQQFETARTVAGLTYERFLPQFERDAFGYPSKVGLLIEMAASAGPTSSEIRWLDDRELGEFVRALRRALSADFQLLAWHGYDFELQGDAAGHLEELDTAVRARQEPPVLISAADIYALDHYSSRVEEIGFEKPYYSPHIAKKQEEAGWFPDNIVPMIAWTPTGEAQPVAVPISPTALQGIRQKIAQARAQGHDRLTLPGLPTPIGTDEAASIEEALAAAIEAAAGGRLNPTKPARPDADGRRKSPVIRPNIVTLDYAESRADALACQARPLTVPTALRAEMTLLPHQQTGVAWLQGLFEARETLNCRGAVLADDMGLGKTLQLLTLMAWIIEQNPQVAPMLVVAPVSLLENWNAEAGKFFVEGALPILTAYGDALAALRVPVESVEQRLREDGLVKFLKPNWVANARIVLTTYETLRDLEFSFARQTWSVMVCDEAQKIKNPSAMVTRAAKKQNVAFRIACTGTPVENTLADLWCLFDFVQPGLLGALNDFGGRYRRPIEARTDEECARIEELRRLIAPQILRRTKADVASDLPKKVIVDNCRRLTLSPEQRELYARALDQFKESRQSGVPTPFKNHFALLHYLRQVCTDPRRHGLSLFTPEPLDEYRRRTPKLDWLLHELDAIRSREDKVLLFCEFREVQRLLRHYIEVALGVRADIVNGDTTAASSQMNSRQKRIDLFQARPGFGVIILSPAAVGYGLNIQAANHVVHYTRAWNPAREDQATDRVHRIGQQKTVYVYYPVVRADDFVTFDVKLDQLLDQKRSLAQDMLNGAGDLLVGDFRIDDVIPSYHGIESLDQVTDRALQSMTWEYFEGLISVLYAKRGFHAFRTPTHDNGVDVVVLARDGTAGKLVQVKSSGQHRPLGWDAVKEVVTGKAFYDRRYPGTAFARVCITNQSFNDQARDNAMLNAVELVERPDLLAMLQETPVTMLEIEQALGATWNDGRTP